jgi:hypothetical protein
MLSSFLGVLPILTPPLCALALSYEQSPIPLLETHELIVYLATTDWL